MLAKTCLLLRYAVDGKRVYVGLVESMRLHDSTTMHISFAHLLQYSESLAEIVQKEYYRYIQQALSFLPYWLEIPTRF